MIFGFLGKFGIGIAPKIIGKVHLVAENGPLKVGDIDFPEILTISKENPLYLHCKY